MQAIGGYVWAVESPIEGTVVFHEDAIYIPVCLYLVVTKLTHVFFSDTLFTASNRSCTVSTKTFNSRPTRWCWTNSASTHATSSTVWRHPPADYEPDPDWTTSANETPCWPESSVRGRRSSPTERRTALPHCCRTCLQTLCSCITIPVLSRLLFAVHVFVTSHLRNSSNIVSIDRIEKDSQKYITVYGHHGCRCYTGVPRVWLLRPFNCRLHLVLGPIHARF